MNFNSSCTSVDHTLTYSLTLSPSHTLAILRTLSPSNFHLDGGPTHGDEGTASNNFPLRVSTLSGVFFLVLFPRFYGPLISGISLESAHMCALPATTRWHIAIEHREGRTQSVRCLCVPCIPCPPPVHVAFFLLFLPHSSQTCAHL